MRSPHARYASVIWCGIAAFRRSIFFLAHRTVQHSRLAETAAADTAALNLKHNAILRGFDKRNDRLFRIDRIRHIHHELLGLQSPGFPHPPG